MMPFVLIAAALDTLFSFWLHDHIDIAGHPTVN